MTQGSINWASVDWTKRDNQLSKELGYSREWINKKRKKLQAPKHPKWVWKRNNHQKRKIIQQIESHGLIKLGCYEAGISCSLYYQIKKSYEARRKHEKRTRNDSGIHETGGTGNSR